MSAHRPLADIDEIELTHIDQAPVFDAEYLKTDIRKIEVPPESALGENQ